MSDWIEWKGGGCPVEPRTIVKVRFESENGEVYDSRPSPAGGWVWGYLEGIKAYKIENTNSEDIGL